MTALNLSTQRLRAGAIAGLAGGAAFVAVMQVDMAVSGRPVNDVRLLADWGPMSRHWRVAGLVTHGVNSAVVGVIYAAVEERLSGPAWLRGMLFAFAENCALYPLLLVLDRVHPAIKRGDLPPYSRLWPFVAETLRHLTYGLTLGLLFPRILRKS